MRYDGVRNTESASSGKKGHVAKVMPRVGDCVGTMARPDSFLI